MATGMTVLVHAKKMMEDSVADYKTVAEWLAEAGKKEVLRTLFDDVKDKMEREMEGNYDYFCEYGNSDHSEDILGCEDPDRLIQTAKGWDNSIRNTFATYMDRFFMAMKEAKCASMLDFLKIAEKKPDFMIGDYYFDTTLYNLRHAADTYDGCFNCDSYLAVIDEFGEVSTRVNDNLKDILADPRDWAIITVWYK